MHKMIVMAKAKDGEVEALAKWYDETHIPDLLAVPGLVSAERHTVMPLKAPDGSPKWDFMLSYGLEGDPMAVLGNMAKAQVALSDLMESSLTLSIVAMSQGVRTES
jgi:hypothetical protein